MVNSKKDLINNLRKISIEGRKRAEELGIKESDIPKFVDKLRRKIDNIKLKQAMMEIAHLKGASKRKTTEEEYEMMRKLGFEKIYKDLK